MVLHLYKTFAKNLSFVTAKISFLATRIKGDSKNNLHVHVFIKQDNSSLDFQMVCPQNQPRTRSHWVPP